MPTGYTADVGEGKITTLREFAMICARAFGACITMRDAPMDADIPERFEPDFRYYAESLAAANALLIELNEVSSDEAERRATTEYIEQLASHEKYWAERDLENDRYRTMLSSVQAWNTEADGIKEFMIQQLEISISDYRSDPPTLLTGPEWLRKKRSNALRDIAYYEKQIAEEIHRTEMRNLWLAALRRSLPVEEIGSAA